MKKVVASFAAFLLVFSVPVLFAQMPLGVPVVSGISQDLTRIGVVAAAGGKVELMTPGQIGRVAQSGQPVFMGDLVKTDAKGHLQILLLDETVFTIGPNSAITIDKFVYDPRTKNGEIRASITHGVFRYVSGKIAAKNPNSVTVKLPTATLGFRGTIVGGSVGADGQGLVGLLGPGDNNDAGAQPGSFTIEGAGGDQQQVNRAGFGVEVGAGGGLSGVFQLSGEQINGLAAGLGGGQGNGDQGGGGGGSGGEGENGGLGGDNMGDLSGENSCMTGDEAGFTQGLSGLSDSLNNFATIAAQDETHHDAVVPPEGTSTAFGSITDSADMDQVTDAVGFHFFSQAAVDLHAPGDPSTVVGNYTIYLEIDFESKTFGGGASRVDVNYNSNAYSFLLNDSPQGFPDTVSSDTPSFSFENIAESSEAQFSVDVNVTVLNKEGGVIGTVQDTAINATHEVILMDTVSVEPLNVGIGEGTVARSEVS